MACLCEGDVSTAVELMQECSGLLECCPTVDQIDQLEIHESDIYIANAGALLESWRQAGRLLSWQVDGTCCIGTALCGPVLDIKNLLRCRQVPIPTGVRPASGYCDAIASLQESTVVPTM